MLLTSPSINCWCLSISAFLDIEGSIIPTFLNLSTEILRIVCSRLPSSPLRSLTYICRRLTGIVVPLSRSYGDSVSLRAHVRNVDIRWHNADNNDDDNVRQCLAALKSLCLQSLRLFPPTFFFEEPAGTAVTLLAIQHDRLRGNF